MQDYTQLFVNALVEGWSLERVALYDEEGVEGWQWTSPEGYEYNEVGSWTEFPAIPQEVFLRLDY